MTVSSLPFWGGVLAVTFYQLVFTNPVAFLSLGVGIATGFGIALYAVAALVIRGYISLARGFAESLTSVLKEHPTIDNYVNNVIRNMSPSPPERSVHVFPPERSARAPCDVNTPDLPRRDPPRIPGMNANIQDILKELNIKESNVQDVIRQLYGDNVSNAEPSGPSADETPADKPACDTNSTAAPGARQDAQSELAAEVPETCRGHHGPDPAAKGRAQKEMPDPSRPGGFPRAPRPGQSIPKPSSIPRSPPSPFDLEPL